VSRELHDGVSQNIARLQFDIERLEQKLPPEMADEKSRLAEISDDVGQFSDELRRIAYGLHPSTLDHLGLAVALRAFCREFAKRTRMRVRFTAGHLPSPFPPDIANSLYRITQEALHNVARHASDCAVSIRLTARGSIVKLTIRDDGPGFDRDLVRSKGGLGLISMRERARLIHASFDLVTEPGAGASITVTVQRDAGTSGTR
jgi:signal transduction histidine kinase